MDLSSLMRRIQQGDRDAFATLYTRYNKTVYRVALDATHDKDEAVQVVKAVFREMYQTIRTKGPYLGDLYGWLDALTAKQIRLRRLMRATPAAAASSSSPRSYSPEEAAALQQRVNDRLQRINAQPTEPIKAPAVKEAPAAPVKKSTVRSLRTPPDPEAYEDEDEDDDDKPAGKSSGAFSIVALSVTALLLLWVLVGLLGSLGILPELPLGYAWFNQTLFPLF
jgi:hypothetical protein